MGRSFEVQKVNEISSFFTEYHVQFTGDSVG